MDPSLKSFFDTHGCLRAVIDACLEGKAGEIRAASKAPAALRLDVGCYAIFGGDPGSEDARSLIESSKPGHELVHSGLRWKQQIQAVFPQAVDASMSTFIPGRNCPETAPMHAAAVHPDYQIRSLTPEDALPEHLKPNGLQVFENHKAFFKLGFGLVAVKGEKIVAQSTTYALSSRKAEIAIATDPSHRNKGLATSLAGAMLMACSEKGLEPHWSASNPVSQRLARRLGFIDHQVCQVLVVPKPARRD